MSVVMWFVLGLLCGVAVAWCVLDRKRLSDVEKSEVTPQKPPKSWVETRNFLYYDGTEMPVVKEEKNEQ